MHAAIYRFFYVNRKIAYKEHRNRVRYLIKYSLACPCGRPTWFALFAKLNTRKSRLPLFDIFSDEWKQIFSNKHTTISYLAIIKMKPTFDDAYLETIVAVHQPIITKHSFVPNHGKRFAYLITFISVNQRIAIRSYLSTTNSNITKHLLTPFWTVRNRTSQEFLTETFQNKITKSQILFYSSWYN